MAARTRALKLNDRWREKIQITQILNRLNACMRGEIEMTPVQIQAAKILLSKVAPDLTAISGEIIHNHRSEMVREIIIQPIENPHSSVPALIEVKPEYVEIEPMSTTQSR